MSDIEAPHTAEEYREGAERVRQIAEITTDRDTRRLLLGIAETYDRMAEKAEHGVDPA
jgi:hypothetical protein